MRYRFIVIAVMSTLLLSTGGCRKEKPAPPLETTSSDAATPVVDTKADAKVNAKAAENYYQIGRKLAMQGKFDDAIVQFDKAIESNPEYFQAYDKLGMLHYNKGQHDQAVEPLKKALSFNPALTDEQAEPDDIATAALDSAMLFDVGQNQAAFEYLTTLGTLHPDAPTVKTVMLFCKLAEEEKNSNNPVFQNIAATDIDECEKNLHLARGYVLLGNAESAAVYYDKVVETCSSRMDVLTQAAYYFAMARKPEKSIDICQQGLEHDPACYPLRYVLANVYGAMGMLDEAIETANDGVLAAPRDVRCYYLLASRYIKAERFAAAAGVYDAMLSYVKEDPDYFTPPSISESGDLPDETAPHDEDISDRFCPEEVYANLALCYNRINDFEKAVTYANKAIEANEAYPPAYLNLSGAYQGLKQYDKAMEAIDKGIEQSPASPAMYFEKAGIYHQIDEPAKAIEPLKKVLELDPGNVMAFQGLAQTYSKMERFEDALPYFEKALQNQPDMITVGNVVACYVKLGQKQKALAVYKTYTGQNDDSFVSICCKDGQRALEEKRYQDAGASFDTALFADPKCAEALYGMGCVFVETGQHNKAAQLATLLEQLNIELYDDLIRRINSGS